MKHAPTSAVALFFDEIRNEATNKTSWMGNYAAGLNLLDSDIVPVDRIAVVVVLHWRFGTEPRSIRIVVETPFGPIEQRIRVPDPANKRPAELSPFAGLRLTLPMNLRLQPLAAGMVIDAWLVEDAEGDDPEERYPLGRLIVSGPAAQEMSPPQLKRRRRRKPGAEASQA